MKKKNQLALGEKDISYIEPLNVYNMYDLKWLMLLTFYVFIKYDRENLECWPFFVDLFKDKDEEQEGSANFRLDEVTISVW